MGKILQYSAWQMTIPQIYGIFHISAAIIGISIAVGMAFFSRHISRKRITVIVFAIGLFLTVIEIYKQLFYCYLGNGQYNWWTFPFQLCSIPMYLCLLYPWLKRNRYQKIIESFLMTFGLLGGIAAFIDPSGFFTSYVTLTFHGIIWHIILIYLGCLMGFTCTADISKKDYRNSYLLFLILCTVAEILNGVLHRYGSMNMFYISLWEPVTQIFFRDIEGRIGRIAANLLYILTVSLGAGLLRVIWTMYLRKTIHLRQDIKEKG